MTVTLTLTQTLTPILNLTLISTLTVTLTLIVGKPLVDMTPPSQKLQSAREDVLMETMQKEPYVSALHRLFDQFRALGEIRPAPGLSSKKIGIMMREGKIIDLRVSKGVISVILREVAAKDIHHPDAPVPGSGAGSGMGQVMLKFRQFMIFIAVLSVKKYTDEDPEVALQLTLENHLLPLLTDIDEARFSAHPDSLAEMKKQHEMMVAIFSHYCAKEQDAFMVELGTAYQPPERLFRLGVDGAQLFALDMNIARTLMSKEAVTVCFDSVMFGTGENTLRFPEFIQWIACLGNKCFNNKTYPEMRGPNNEALRTAKMLRVIESAHDTALVMHMRGQVNGDTRSFEDWEARKKVTMTRKTGLTLTLTLTLIGRSL